MNHSFGEILKTWRKHRRYSQLQLALELDISTKHISFIETGKSTPSKAMILKIATFLVLPKAEINQALYVAGYAPIYTKLSVADDNFKPVFDAINQTISNHMPYPAVVLDQNWDLIKANVAAQELLNAIGYSHHRNLLEALIEDKPETSKIINWHEVAGLVLIRLRQEMSLLGNPTRLQELEKRLRACVSADILNSTFDTKQAVFATRFKLSNEVYSFFSILAQLGTVQDITVSEYRIELMFPADDATKAFYEK